MMGIYDGFYWERLPLKRNLQNPKSITSSACRWCRLKWQWRPKTAIVTLCWDGFGLIWSRMPIQLFHQLVWFFFFVIWTITYPQTHSPSNFKFTLYRILELLVVNTDSDVKESLFMSSPGLVSQLCFYRTDDDALKMSWTHPTYKQRKSGRGWIQIQDLVAHF